MKRIACSILIEWMTGLGAFAGAALDPSLEFGVRYSLVETAGALGWEEVSVQAEAYAASGWRFTLPHARGVLSIIVDADPVKLEETWKATRAGQALAFYDRPAVRVGMTNPVPLSSIAWKETNLIASVTVVGGDSLSAASLLYSNLMRNAVIPGWTPASPKAGASRPFILDAAVLESRGIRVVLRPRGAPEGVVAIVHLRDPAADRVLRKTPVLVTAGDPMPLRFPAPVLGWSDGVYAVEAWIGETNVQTWNFDIREGKLVHE